MTALLHIIYYAHPISMYGTAEEEADIAFLDSRGYIVENPSSDHHKEAVAAVRARFAPAIEAAQAAGHKDELARLNKDVGKTIMEHFVATCGGCNAVAFACFPDGSVGAGVAKEVQSFLDRGAEAFQLKVTDGVRELVPVIALDGYDVLNVEATRAMLATLSPAYKRELGARPR